jgi:hypothetical protein
LYLDPKVTGPSVRRINASPYPSLIFYEIAGEVPGASGSGFFDRTEPIDFIPFI